jgi:hypothetical protein
MATHLATAPHNLHSKLYDFQQSRLRQQSVQQVSMLPSMEDRAVQTKHGHQPNMIVDVMTIYSEHIDLSYDSSIKPGALDVELTASQSDYETLGLEALNRLEDCLYGHRSNPIFSGPVIKLVFQDSVLKSTSSFVCQLFGEKVPWTCILSGQRSKARKQDIS